MRQDVQYDFDWQHQFVGHYSDITRTLLRVDVAGVEDDRRRNTDLIVLRTRDDWRIACRARRAPYRLRFGEQFTIRLRRANGVKTEMAKIREGWGDFGIYGFAFPDEEAHRGRLAQWALFNLALFREYLDDGGRWYERENEDGESSLAAFDFNEIAGRKLGFVVNSDGLGRHPWPPGSDCRICGRPSWQHDNVGPIHRCCAIWAPGPCPACAATNEGQHTRYGWPDEP